MSLVHVRQLQNFQLWRKGLPLLVSLGSNIGRCIAHSKCSGSNFRTWAKSAYGLDVVKPVGIRPFMHRRNEIVLANQHSTFNIQHFIAKSSDAVTEREAYDLKLATDDLNLAVTHSHHTPVDRHIDGKINMSNCGGTTPRHFFHYLQKKSVGRGWPPPPDPRGWREAKATSTLVFVLLHHIYVVRHIRRKIRHFVSHCVFDALFRLQHKKSQIWKWSLQTPIHQAAYVKNIRFVHGNFPFSMLAAWAVMGYILSFRYSPAVPR